MVYGFLRRQLGLEIVPGIKPRPRAHAGADDTDPHDPGPDAHATVPAGPDSHRGAFSLDLPCQQLRTRHRWGLHV